MGQIIPLSQCTKPKILQVLRYSKVMGDVNTKGFFSRVTAYFVLQHSNVVPTISKWDTCMVYGTLPHSHQNPLGTVRYSITVVDGITPFWAGKYVFFSGILEVVILSHYTSKCSTYNTMCIYPRKVYRNICTQNSIRMRNEILFKIQVEFASRYGF